MAAGLEPGPSHLVKCMSYKVTCLSTIIIIIIVIVIIRITTAIVVVRISLLYSRLIFLDRKRERHTTEASSSVVSSFKSEL